MEGTWARRARSGIRVRKTREPGQALPGLWGALRKLWPRRRRVPRVKALPAGGRGRGAHLRPPCEPPNPPPPHPASIAQGRWSPPSLGFEPSPGFPGALGPAVPGGRTKVLAGGTGRKRDLLDLDRRGHFPSSGIWPCSPQPTPTPPARAPVFPHLRGAFCVSSRPELTRGAALAFWLPELHPVPAAAAG